VKVFCDSSHEETRILASGGKNMGDETDRLFLQLLAESAGQHFGIEMAGGAPSKVRSSVADRSFLLEMFVDLFEVTGMEESIRADLERHGERVSGDQTVNGTDFRSEVDRWLTRTLKMKP
jgi:hypothetical protein